MRVRLLAIGVAVCASGGVAHAQVTMPKTGTARIFHGSTSLNAVYDSNFSRSSAAQAKIRGVKPHEVTVRPGISLDVAQPLGRQYVYLSGNAAYNFHKENKQLDRGSGNLSGGYVASLGFCQAAVTGGITAAQADLAQLDTIATKNLLKTTNVGAGLQCSRPQGFFGGVQVARIESQNSAKVQRTADSTAETTSLQGGYTNATLGQISLVYTYSNVEFPNRIIPGRPVGDGYFTQTYGVSLGRQFGQRIQVSGQVGRTMVKREFAPTGIDQKFTSTTYGANGTYRFGSRLVLEASGGRSVVPTARAGKLYDISTSGRVSATYSLGSRYAISIAEAVQDTKSNTDTSITTPVVTKATTYSTVGTISYQQSRLATLTLNLRYDERNTNLPQFDFSAMQVGVTARVGF